jgi:REP element-mobilizing transposase RayT
VDREHNVPGSRTLAADPGRLAAVQQRMTYEPYLLDESRREVVLTAIVGVCAYRNWGTIAAHVRSTHVHVVVHADVAPERVMNDLKAYSSRALNEIEPPRPRWARHGSTKILFTRRTLEAAVEYVLSKQGKPMAIYQAAR